MTGPILWGTNNTALNLQGGLQLGASGSTLLSGTVDPSSVATSANKGSIYLNTSNGNAYSKSDNGSSTNWVSLGGAAAIGGKLVRTTRFVSIGSLTTGTVSLPPNSTVVLDDFGGTVDAVVTQISGGKPTQLPALTAAGVVVATTFDASGNWVFSGTPVSYPVAIVYRVSQTLTNFDSTASDIWGESEIHSVLPPAAGGTGLATYNAGDIPIASAANVLSSLAKGTAGQWLNQGATLPAWSSVGMFTGTLAQMNAATGVAGQTWFNTTYNSMFYWCVDRWFPYKPDPRYGFMHSEKFLGATVASTWPFGNGTTGTGNALNATPTNLVMGELVLECTAAGQIADIRGNGTQFLLGGADIYFEALLRIPTLATSGEDFSVAWGFNDNPTYDAHSLCVDGIFGSLDRSINTTKIVMNTNSNSTRTATNSSVTALVGGTQFRAGIYINGSTSAQFFINGVSQGTVTTNLPTGAGRYTTIRIRLDKTNGTAQSQLCISDVLVYGFYTTALSA